MQKNSMVVFSRRSLSRGLASLWLLTVAPFAGAGPVDLGQMLEQKWVTDRLATGAPEYPSGLPAEIKMPLYEIAVSGAMSASWWKLHQRFARNLRLALTLARGGLERAAQAELNWLITILGDINLTAREVLEINRSEVDQNLRFVITDTMKALREEFKDLDETQASAVNSFIQALKIYGLPEDTAILRSDRDLGRQRRMHALKANVKLAAAVTASATILILLSTDAPTAKTLVVGLLGGAAAGAGSLFIGRARFPRVSLNPSEVPVRSYLNEACAAWLGSSRVAD